MPASRVVPYLRFGTKTDLKRETIDWLTELKRSTDQAQRPWQWSGTSRQGSWPPPPKLGSVGRVGCPGGSNHRTSGGGPGARKRVYSCRLAPSVLRFQEPCLAVGFKAVLEDMDEKLDHAGLLPFLQFCTGCLHASDAEGSLEQRLAITLDWVVHQSALYWQEKPYNPSREGVSVIPLLPFPYIPILCEKAHLKLPQVTILHRLFQAHSQNLQSKTSINFTWEQLISELLVLEARMMYRNISFVQAIHQFNEGVKYPFTRIRFKKFPHRRT